MLSLVEVVILAVFVFFYACTFYNIPVLAFGVRDLRRSKKRSREQASKEGILPFFSVVLPVKNERTVVGRILESVIHLEYPGDRFEIVVVDDGSEDETCEICRGFAASHENVKVLRLPSSRGKASALNYGVKHCKGDIVATFDADNVPAGDLLSGAAKYFQDPEVAAVQGRRCRINR